MPDCQMEFEPVTATTTPESDTSTKTIVVPHKRRDVYLNKVIDALDANVHENINHDVTKHDILYKKGDAKPEGKSLGFCAHYVGAALAAGGGTLNGHLKLKEQGHPPNAKDWGCLLKRNGFKELTTKVDDKYKPAKGDAVIIQGFPGDTAGHIAIYNGDHWVSDFVQSNAKRGPESFYPNDHYEHNHVPYVIYKKSDWK